MIGELGLRYRPAAQADLEAHAAGIALLAKDVADVPPHLLERAIGEWVQKSRFMPKAAELIDLAKGYLEKPKGEADLEATARRLNADMLTRHDGRQGVQWIAEDGQLRMEYLHQSRPGVMEITATEADLDAYARAQQASKGRR